MVVTPGTIELREPSINSHMEVNRANEPLLKSYSGGLAVVDENGPVVDSLKYSLYA